MGGKADEYLAALARCCQHLPETLDSDRQARTNSIKHCRKRIKLGSAMMRGTATPEPQERFGLAVLGRSLVKYMQKQT